MAADPSGEFNTNNDGEEDGDDDVDHFDDQLESNRHDYYARSTTVVSTNTPSNTNDDVRQISLSPPLLPDGRIIDAKNTVQSFASSSCGMAHPANVVATTNMSISTGDTGGGMTTSNDTPPSHFSLPDGRIIDGKNTLQSFAVPSVSERLLRKSGTPNLPTHRSRNLHNTANVEGTVAVQAEPVVEQSSAVVVEAEIADSRFFLPRPSQHGPLFWFLMAAIGITTVLASVIGGYCGAGNCGGSSNNNSSDSAPSITTETPTLAPVAITNVPVITSSPITARTEQELTVACNFLKYSNIPECQSITFFGSDTLGNTIPTEIGLLTQLTHMSLERDELYGNNPLIGNIPSELGQLTQLTRLDLSGNQLTGNIPSTLGQLTQLADIRFSSNRLNGTIASTLGSLTQLTFLWLFENELSGSIPSTLGNLTQLIELRLNGNHLVGTIPSTVGNLRQLTHLFLEMNYQLSGSIPSTLGNLMQLNWFDVSDNQLTGNIPSEFGQLTKLTWLDLSSNELTGTIPSTLGQLTQLTSLYLSRIQLSGTIPSVLGELTRLNFLWVFENEQLNGTIPSTLCSNSGIEILIDCVNILCTCCEQDTTGTNCP